MQTDLNWQPGGWGSGVCQDDSFFHVPHCPLGEILLWDLPDPRVDRPAYTLAVSAELERVRAINGFGSAPEDAFDHEARQPRGQVMGADGRPGHFANYFWLAIYPEPRGRRLVPVLYQPAEEGGAYLMPLDLETMAMLRQAVWFTPAASIPVTQRLRQLISDPDAPILTAFRRTAPWLAHNPLLRWAEQCQHDLESLAVVVARINDSHH